MRNNRHNGERQPDLFAALCLTVLLSLPSVSLADLDASELIRQRLEAPDQPFALSEPLYNAPLMMRVYQGRVFEPIWVSARGALPRAYRLIDAVAASDADAMQPEDYHLASVSGLLAEQSTIMTAAQQADLDLALSDMFLTFAGHSLRGRVNPNSIDPEWTASPRDQNLEALLLAVASGENVAETLAGLHPQQPGYLGLKKALTHYRDIASRGGWPTIPTGNALKPGEDDPRVLALRSRLGQPTIEGGETRYDDPLRLVVEDFQRRHGLEADGIVGRDTLAALNQSAAAKAQTIAINMERWRWLPAELGGRHIRVNIAGFSLEAWAQGQKVSEQAVVVGRDYRRTPVFSGNMTYLVLNPTWEVPPSIAQKDLLKQIQADPGYLSKMNIQVLQGWGTAEMPIDPATVAWNSLTERSLPYRFRQLPGPLNAQGKVKLMFPNEHAVYLHDTPARNLFAKAKRDFSSGCIRLENPLELSAWALEATSGWDRKRIDQVVEGGQTTTVRLSQPVNVHLLYWTAWVDENGDVQFRNDLYGRDARLLNALQLPPPKSQRSEG